MPRLALPAVLLALLTAVAFAAPPANATHNNQGTVKVHDDEVEDPAMQNVPHVSCDFWIEGFKLGDDSGWIEFFTWPPTGDMTAIAPTGASLEWEADDGNASGEFHFLQGPFQLPAGHYRVEVYTDDGHPGGDGGHFAKAKMFWVEDCENPPENPPPCPPDVTARALDDGSVLVQWGIASGEGYLVYRAEGDGDFELVSIEMGTTNTDFLDVNVTGGVTYRYTVTTFEDDVSSGPCAEVEVTTIPFFPGLVVGALALAGSVGAYVWLRRKA